VIRTSTSSDQTKRNSVLRIQPSHRYPYRERFNVAVMRETLLLVELETQEFCIDLRALSKLVLSDLGATLQVFRLAGCEYGGGEGRPVRVEDCIADLGVQACIDAMSASLMACDRRSAAVTQLWRHSREIAEHSKRLAEHTLDVDPEQAYLVGLCHSIGSLPSALGMDSKACQEFDCVRMGLELAREWSLPGCVVDYFSELGMCGERSAWRGIVQAAHRCAGEPTGECDSQGTVPPQLLLAV